MSTTEDPNFFRQLDAMENLLANIGTSNDRRTASQYVERRLFSRQELEAMYIENWLFGKGIDIIPDDMTREWRTIDSSVDPEQTKQFEAMEKKLGIIAKFNEAQKWARVYGGCGIIIGVDEAQGGMPDTPLVLDNLGLDSLSHLTVIDAERLHYSGGTVITDPTNASFSEPELWTVPGSAMKIHRSRILFFEGIPLPYYPRKRQRLAYWGAPLARRVFEALSNSDLTMNSIATLVSESSHDIIKYKGLQSFLASKGGEEKIRARFAMMKLLKSINNVTLLDEDETFENHTQTFAGLGDLLDRFLAVVCGAFDIPVTRFIGTSAKGLNATGEGDLKNYYDNVRAQQKARFDPNLERLDRIMQRSVFGQEIEDWGYTWDSLFQLTEEQIATVENLRADRDTKYAALNVVDEVQIAKDLYEAGTYTSVTPESIDELEKFKEEAMRMQGPEGNPLLPQLPQPTGAGGAATTGQDEPGRRRPTATPDPVPTGRRRRRRTAGTTDILDLPDILDL